MRRGVLPHGVILLRAILLRAILLRAILLRAILFGAILFGAIPFGGILLRVVLLRVILFGPYRSERFSTEGSCLIAYQTGWRRIVRSARTRARDPVGDRILQPESASCSATASSRNAKMRFSHGPPIACANRAPSGATSTDARAIPSAAGRNT